jgi:hypothetical protein
MDSTTTKVLFVAALFAGVAGMVTLSVGLFGMSLLASKRLHRSTHLLRPRVVSITIPAPYVARSIRTQPRPAAAPPPPPPRPVVDLSIGPSNYVSVVEAAPSMHELIASCTAIRLDPPLQKVGAVPVRRSAGRYR